MDLSALRSTRALLVCPPAGIYAREDLPMERYLSLDAASASTVKNVLDRGPEYADAARRVIHDDTAATERGTAVHMAILEPHDFEARYAPLSVENDLRTTAGKAEKASIVASGRRPIKASTWETCLRLRDRAWQNPTLAALLAQSEPEVTAVWSTGHGDIMGRARADVLARDAQTILDLKTTEDGSPFAFGRAAAGYGYHLSAPWYIDGFTAAGCPVAYWTIGCLTADPDVGYYDVRLYTLDPLVIVRARERVQSALQSWASWIATGQGPAPTGYVPLPLPAWAFTEDAR